MFGWGEKGEEGKFGGEGGGDVFSTVWLRRGKGGEGKIGWGIFHLGSQILILLNREENEITTLPLCYPFESRLSHGQVVTKFFLHSHRRLH
jgi:hypothetical protein